VKMRRLIPIALGLFAAIVLTIAIWPGEREPEYQGKKLSEWLKRYRSGGRERDEAAEAVRQIGSRAVPCLLSWMDNGDLPAWKLRLFRLTAAHPRIITSRLFRKVMQLPNSDRNAFAAYQGFEILGPEAKAAIPALIRLTNDSASPGKAHRALLALDAIGKDALPALLSALANEGQGNRRDIVYCIRDMGYLGTNAEPCVRVLAQCIKGADQPVAVASAAALGTFRASPEIAIPALREASHSTNAYLRRSAVIAIGQFGDRARSAIPDLLEAMNDLDSTVRFAATDALNRIEGRPLVPALE
jgi:hypothetical protein